MFQSAKERNDTCLGHLPFLEDPRWNWNYIADFRFHPCVSPLLCTGIGMMIQTDQITLPYELFTADSFPTYR